MKKQVILTSTDKNSIVRIDKGELVSYIKNEEELIHQKGAPGWRNSDTEMFPIIGPTNTNNFVVSTPIGDSIQDQHGILRELEYLLLQNNSSIAIFQKKYSANTIVSNSKYPEKSPKKEVFWLYDFSFKKSYKLTNDSLTIQFEIESEKGMPFMLGYHPAFKLSGDYSEICEANNQQIELQKIMDGGSSAYPVINTEEITLIKNTGTGIHIKTEGFHNFMLWTEVPNMLCIEPITEYPYSESQKLTSDRFRISSGKEIFKVIVSPI